MKKAQLLYISFALCIVSFIFIGSSNGVADTQGVDRTGSPISLPICSSCHGGGNFGATFDIQVLDKITGSPISEYQPDSIYDVQFTVNTSTGSPQRFGFQSVALTKGANLNAGTFSNPASNTEIHTIGNGRTYVEQMVKSVSNVFTVEWQAPSAGSDTLVFYGVGNAVNNNGATSGDQSTSSISVTLPEVLPPATDATLSNLQVSGTTVSGFMSDTLNYNVILPFGTTVVPTVAATSNDANANIFITDASALPGTTTVDVTAEDAVTALTYSINFTLGVNTDASLSDLQVNGSSLDGFNGTIFNYNDTLPFGTTMVPGITAIPADVNATVMITDAAALPGTSTIFVKAEDTTFTATYSIQFTVGKNNNADLIDLKVDGTTVMDFMAADTFYTVELPVAVTVAPPVAATAADSNASIMINNALNIPGMTTVEVTADDGKTTKTYFVDFTVVSGLGMVSPDELNLNWFQSTHGDKLHITMTGKVFDKRSIGLYDLNGQLLHSQILLSGDVRANVLIDVRNFAKGTYLLLVKSADGYYSEKVILY